MRLSGAQRRSASASIPAAVTIAGISTTLAVAAAIPVAERQGRTILVAVESKRAEIYVEVSWELGSR